jgi:hypothetical protein
MMLTKHVLRRAQERSIRETDLGLVCEFGTSTARGTVLTRNDILAVEREAAYLLDRLRKMQNVFVAVDGEDLITTYRATKKQVSRLIDWN